MSLCIIERPLCSTHTHARPVRDNHGSVGHLGQGNRLRMVIRPRCREKNKERSRESRTTSPFTAPNVRSTWLTTHLAAIRTVSDGVVRTHVHGAATEQQNNARVRRPSRRRLPQSSTTARAVTGLSLVSRVKIELPEKHRDRATRF